MDESRPQGAIRVLVADDEPAMRSVLRDMLARVPSITVVGLAANADEAARLAAELRPDVALLDVRMPAGGGPAAASAIGDRGGARACEVAAGRRLAVAQSVA